MLFAFVAERVALFKKLRDLEFVELIPKSPTRRRRGYGLGSASPRGPRLLRGQNRRLILSLDVAAERGGDRGGGRGVALHEGAEAGRVDLEQFPPLPRSLRLPSVVPGSAAPSRRRIRPALDDGPEWGVDRPSP